MEQLTITNAFSGAPCFFVEETSSTMLNAKSLVNAGFPSGTVICANFQTAGRGRTEGRTWCSNSGLNLLFTVILRENIEGVPVFPLKVALALVRTLQLYALQNELPMPREPAIKWPNDVLVEGKKVAGILCEASNGVLYAGIGLNVNQTEFPLDLRTPASSLKNIFKIDADRFRLLEIFLSQLSLCLNEEHWKADFESFLYKKGELVRFESGLAESKNIVEGIINGVSDEGELGIRDTKDDSVYYFASGEIVLS